VSSPAVIDVAAEVPSGIPVAGRLVASGPEPLAPGVAVPAAAGSLGFAGELGETFVTATGEGAEVFVGCGARDSFTALEARRAAASFARELGKSSAAVLDLTGASGDRLPASRLAQAVVEGVGGATYRFDRYRSEREESALGRLVLVASDADPEELRRGVERARAIVEAVRFARDLVNSAAGDLPPRVLAERAAEVAASCGATITVLDEDEIVAERLGGLLGVARGSHEPPRLVKMVYEPEEAPGTGNGRIPTVALVGKGITFDSGGLSLKPPDGMIGMKGDMSGAAVVLATVSACRALGIRARVVAIAPVTENMPGGRAIKPGDVLTIRNGKTIEVLNTDAEGRLVLSDGLVLATEHEPDAIIDVATLTGACVVALGNKVAGVMGNDSKLVGALEAASARSGEPIWRLPLPRQYRKDIDSDIADMKNMGKQRQAGALVAGLLLEEFVGDHPWAHLDIAGPAESDEESYELRKGATGFGIRTLLEFLEEFAPGGETRRTADHVGVG
jgi:leucyl aminopeptidase